MNVQVITDSTCDLPQETVDKMGIRVVPIYVRFGEKFYRDGVDISADQFYSMLTSLPDHPATSQPNPEDFTGVYREYCESVDGIVSIHISSRISGTWNSATIAKKTLISRCPIEVIDSGFNSAGLGLVVLAAARAARSGAGYDEVIREARRAISQVRMFGMFQTMQYLVRSGRVNKTISAASRILHVMPLLTFREGEIVRAGLVRTVNSGMERICNFVRNNMPVSELTVVHSAVPDLALELKQRLGRYFPEEKIPVHQLGAGLGGHGGPGVLLAAVRRAGTHPAG